MKQYLSFILQLMLLVLPCRVPAATVDFKEHLVNTQSQLPVSAIHSIYRDRQGYLWYGTVNGLCRDDGYNLQVFRPDFLQAQDKVIVSMAEDDSHHLWLGADNGLYWLDKRNYEVSPLYPERWEGQRISLIIPAGNGKFWFQGRNYVAIVDSVGHPIKEYSRKDNAGNLIGIQSMVLYENQIYSSFSDHTLARLDLATEEWIDIETPNPQDQISQLCNDKKQDGIWILYSQGDVYHAYINEGGLAYQRFACDQPMSDFAYGIQQSAFDGVLWIMNTYGLRGYLPQDDCTLQTVYSSMEDTPRYHMLANVLTDSLFTFVSAFDRPSYLLRSHAFVFQHDPLQELSDRLLFNAAVMAFASAGDGWWWVFQERTGLCLVHRESGKVVLWSDCPQTRGYSLDKGRIISPSSRGVWVNHDDRMFVYRLERTGASMQVISELDMSSMTQAGEIVTALYEDTHRRLWVGTNMGLYIYQANPVVSLAQFPKAGYVSQIVEDSQGHIWTTTLDGRLCEYTDPDHMETRLETEPLSAISFNTDGMLWLGSQAGHIFKFNVRAREVEDFSEACGMNGDRVNQLVTDQYGHLWIETNQRIIEYNPRNNASHTYETSDVEIPMSRFLPTAMMKDEDGRICFGGIPGVICFEPGNWLDSEARLVKTFITDVRVMKRSLLFEGDQLRTDNHIELQSDDRDLEIFFSSLDHYNVRHVRYAYRLHGVDKDWKFTFVGQNSAFYNHLAKGKYIFEVKATDSNGLWSDHVAQLEIVRLPAFYESKWAYIIYAMLLLAALAALIMVVHRRDEIRNELMWSDSREMLQMRNYLRGERQSSPNDSNRLPESEFRQLDQAFIQKVDRSIQEHLAASDFGVEELAAAVNVSKSTLSRKLKSITGVSPLDYIRQKKMTQACLWLQDKDRNVTEIAIALGYSDRKYFTTCFKKEFGMAPTDYRREKFGMRTEGEIGNLDNGVEKSSNRG